MNREEIIDILTAVQVVDHRTVGEGDITMWGAILADLPKDLALQAVVDHRREQPGVWLEPGHIHARVRAIRQDRAMRQPLKRLEAGDDYRERVNRARLAAMIAVSKIGHHDDQPPPALGPRRIPCPHCKAQAARRCVVPATSEPLRHPPYYHDSRIRAAGAAPPVPRATSAIADVTCSVCERELITAQETSRSVCDRCQPTVNSQTTPARDSPTA